VKANKATSNPTFEISIPWYNATPLGLVPAPGLVGQSDDLFDDHRIDFDIPGFAVLGTFGSANTA
jgi:hypothetical protein